MSVVIDAVKALRAVPCTDPIVGAMLGVVDAVAEMNTECAERRRRKSDGQSPGSACGRCHRCKVNHALAAFADSVCPNG